MSSRLVGQPNKHLASCWYAGGWSHFTRADKKGYAMYTTIRSIKDKNRLNSTTVEFEFNVIRTQ